MKDIQKYFGSTNSGTAYLFLYTAFDFDHSDILSSIMPKGWVPPTQVKDYSTTPTSFEPVGSFDNELSRLTTSNSNHSGISMPEETTNFNDKEETHINSMEQRRISSPHVTGRKSTIGWGWLSGKPSKKKSQ
jgi:hypothetical protein